MAAAPVIDIKPAMLATLLAATDITALLGSFDVGGLPAPSIHTRKPVPDSAQNPCIVIEEITTANNDGISQYRPTVSCDITVYGDNPDQYRVTERIAKMIKAMLHQCDRGTVIVANHDVIDIVCAGPSPAPTDDEKEVARVVTLTARLVVTSTTIHA